MEKEGRGECARWGSEWGEGYQRNASLQHSDSDPPARLPARVNEFERLGVEAGVVCRDLNSAVVKAAALKAVLYARTATYVLHRMSGTHQSQGGNRPILHTHKDYYISNITSSDSIFSLLFPPTTLLC